MAYNQKIMRMKELIEKLTEADIAYYKNDNPIMTDREYDLLFDELAKLETETSLMLSGSPTQKVSGEILESLTPVTHSKPMLSADKTKSVDDLIKFAKGRDVLLSWKLDGLTIVLRYKDGKLEQAITRGAEGIVGEDVTHTVKTFVNVPLTIPEKSEFEVRGEGVVSYKNFNEINLGDIPVSVSSEGSYGECVLLPSTGNGLLLFDVAGNQYRKKIGNMTFEMGKQYTFDQNR